MSIQIIDLPGALDALVNIKNRFVFYKDGLVPEANCPGAIATTQPEFQALAVAVANSATVAAPKFIVTSQFGWATGRNPLEAWKKCKSQTPYGKKTGRVKTYLAHPDTVVFGDGSWEYPHGCAPIELKEGK